MNLNAKEVPVLFIDDAQSSVDAMLRGLRKSHIRGDWRRVNTPQMLRDVLVSFNPHIVVADFPVREFPGTAALKLVRSLHPNVPFVFAASAMSEAQAIQALKDGAAEVINREPGALVSALKRVLIHGDDGLTHEHAERRLLTQYEIARIMAEGGSLREAVIRIFQTICERENFVGASMWKVTPEADALQCVDIWVHDDPKLATFAAASRKLKIAPGHGLAGRAWSSRAPVWSTDFSLVSDLPRPAIRAGLRSGMAFPIAVGGEVIGVMVFWGYALQEKNPDLLEMFRAIGSQIGLFVERTEQRESIRRLNSVYAVRSSINAVVVRVKNRQQLFEAACRFAVEDGSFGIAWVGLYDQTTQSVKPVAWAGLDAEQVMTLTAQSTTRADDPSGQGALGQAIRQKSVAIDNDIVARGDVGGPRRREAMRRGYHSVMVMPLLAADVVIGTFSLFAKEQGFFSAEEAKLLTGLAGEISFAAQYLVKQEQLEYLATHDELTDVANRNLLDDRLRQAIGHARRANQLVSVVVLGLDNFRLINNSLGHNAGDQLLKTMASRLQACLRDTDTVARLGGDIFVMVLPTQRDLSAALRGVSRIAASLSSVMDGRLFRTMMKIKDAVGTPIEIDGRSISVTCSMGVSLFPMDGEDNETLIKRADAALSRAKKSNRGSVQFYHADHNTKLEGRLELQALMRQALAQKEFSLYYQPKIGLHDSAISGVEALIRWNRPGYATVSPNDFIPCLEETGLIVDVGRWVMETAAAQYMQWLEDGVANPPRIAVNVSQLQLSQGGFSDIISSIMHDWPLVKLDLELTESMLMQDIDTNLPKLHAIRDLGVSVVIDDFGTGYSSLSYLAQMPINALKIDRSFIAAMESSPQNLAIVATIISLAHTLNLRVVAEGVETESQREVLQQMGCDEIQGYLISPPLPTTQFSTWMQQH